jgi:O-antigen/teichoic acid export membrane protein
VYSTYLAYILGLGLPNAVSYALATGKSEASSLLASIVRYACFLILPAVLLGIYAGLELTHFSMPGRMGVALLIGLTPVAVVGLCLDAILRAKGDLGVLAATRFLALGLPALAVVLLWVAGTLTVLSMTIVAVIVVCLVVVYSWARLAIWPRRPEPLLPLVGYGSRSAFGTLAAAVSARLDQAMIAPILGAAALGLYSVAVTVASLPLALSFSVGARAFSEIGAAPEERKLAVAASYIRMALLLSIPAAVGVGLLAPMAVPLLYGAAFKASIAPAILLLPSTIALSFLATAELCMSALGRPGRVSLAEGAGTIVGVVALLLLLHPFGIVGAAVATSLDFTISAAVLVAFYRSLGPCSLFPGGGDVHRLKERLGLSASRFARSGMTRLRGA